MRLSEEASFEAKDKVIHWVMVIQWPVHDCTICFWQTKCIHTGKYKISAVLKTNPKL